MAVVNPERCIFCNTREVYRYRDSSGNLTGLCKNCHTHANTTSGQFEYALNQRNEIVSKIKTITITENLYMEAGVNKNVKWPKEVIVMGQWTIGNSKDLTSLPEIIRVYGDLKIYDCYNLGKGKMPKLIECSGVVHISESKELIDLYDTKIRAQLVRLEDCPNLQLLPRELGAESVSLHGSTSIRFIPPNTNAQIHCGMAQIDNIPVNEPPSI